MCGLMLYMLGGFFQYGCWFRPFRLSAATFQFDTGCTKNADTGWTKTAQPNLRKVNIHHYTRKKCFMHVGLLKCKKKCGGTASYVIHKWILVCRFSSYNSPGTTFCNEIVVNNPSQTWWREVGFQKSVYCNICMKTPGGHFEHLSSLLGGCNSEMMLRKVCVPILLFSCIVV